MLSHSLSSTAVGFLLTAFAAAQSPLTVVEFSTTPNGFGTPARGWNSFGIQANTGTTPSWGGFNQENVLNQARALVAAIPSEQLASGDYYISLDSGWSVGGNGDDQGRIIDDTSVFKISDLAAQLHSMGLKLGVYIVPGSFEADADKTIAGTNILIKDTWNGHNNGLARMDFDYSKDGVQQWHDSVIALFAEWGVDLVKFDYVTPGSPSNGVSLGPDTSGSVIAYHKAIQKANRPIRLDISWKLERNATFFPVWATNADSMRTDQDINNGGGNTFVSWSTVQRAIENYRQFVTTAIEDGHLPLAIKPDMDNMYICNPESVSGVSDTQRTTIATHWVSAGANLITGCDLTNIDDHGKSLLTSAEVWQDIANFTARYPMQPRNPGTGNNDPQQVQAWIAGPNDAGEAIVVLANYGPDQGQGGFGTSKQGSQSATVSWSDLGISGSYSVRDVWNDSNLGVIDSQINVSLDESESRLLRLTRS